MVGKTAPKPAIELIGVSKAFGTVQAVAALDLVINDGEFFSMLGPSGSGKTTVLRIIAGFEPATAGVVKLDGEDVTSKAPFDRDVNTVFQDYALFPHMSVLENVAYGLRVRGVSKKQREFEALEALEMVQLLGFENRRPSELSGGQRQRVALARAVVVKPKVLLLDEPLGALDLKLREQMQIELKQLQRKLGITFIFVTHDQEEALTLSDRVAVFNKGRIEQIGSPRELYDNPASEFVAKFVGTSNIFSPIEAQSLLGSAGTFSIRPEKIHVAKAGNAADGVVNFEAEVIETIYVGTATRLIVQLAQGKKLTILRQSASGEGNTFDRHDKLFIQFNKTDLVQLNK